MDKKEGRPRLEVIRGGKPDEASLIKRAGKILLKVQNTGDVAWLFSVFNQYKQILDNDENLKGKENESVESMVAGAAKRLAYLGYSVEDQKDEHLRKKSEKYNV